MMSSKAIVGILNGSEERAAGNVLSFGWNPNGIGDSNGSAKNFRKFEFSGANENLSEINLNWNSAVSALDSICPAWELKIHDIRQFSEYVSVTISLNVHGVVREGIGVAGASIDGIRLAERYALVDAARKFSDIRNLIDETMASESDPCGNYSKDGFSGNPIAASIADFVTSAQLGLIKSLSKFSQTNADKECMRKLGCEVSELSKRAAEYFIDHLRKLKNVSKEYRTPLQRAG